MYTSQALLLLLLCFLVTAFVSLLISRKVSVGARRRHHEVGIAVFLQIGVIYAVLLAFVFSEVWDQFNDAGKVVDTECSDILGIAERADNIPEGARLQLRHDVMAYLTLEIGDEWPKMEHRHFSLATSTALTRIYNDIAAIPPDNPRVAAARDRMLTLVGDVHTQRAQRLFQLRSNVPPFLWGLLITDAVMLIAFVLFSGMEHTAVQIGVVGVFATFLCGILLTIHLLDFPYEGTISISDEPVRMTLEQVTTMVRPAG
jgi:hypothetical protein